MAGLGADCDNRFEAGNTTAGYPWRRRARMSVDARIPFRIRISLSLIDIRFAIGGGEPRRIG
jgi:hypothetical protein